MRVVVEGAPEPWRERAEVEADTERPSPLALRRIELAELYRVRQHQFTSFFRRAGFPMATAKDLTHDTFVSALIHLPQFNGDALLFTWVWRIAINTLNAYLRAAARREHAVGGAEDVHSMVPVILTEGPEAALTENRRRDCIRRQFAMFARAHPERAMALSMAELEDVSREELGRWLGRTPGATREYLSQCRKLLGSFLSECRD